jgi:hypothetical protein
MGLSDWFRQRAPSPRPDDLLSALLDGFERQDAPRLMQLINENSETIRAEFKSWTALDRAPQGPAAMERYAKMLWSLATLFENSGDRSLKDWLEGRGRGENPIAQWDRALDQADRLRAC